MHRTRVNLRLSRVIPLLLPFATSLCTFPSSFMNIPPIAPLPQTINVIPRQRDRIHSVKPLSSTRSMVSRPSLVVKYADVLDFCLWGAPGLYPNQSIGDVEAAVVAYVRIPNLDESYQLTGHSAPGQATGLVSSLLAPSPLSKYVKPRSHSPMSPADRSSSCELQPISKSSAYSTKPPSILHPRTEVVSLTHTVPISPGTLWVVSSTQPACLRETTRPIGRRRVGTISSDRINFASSFVIRVIRPT